VSRYLILLIFNVPFVAIGITNALIRYKLSKISLPRFLSQLTLWLLIFAGLALAKPIYTFLFSNKLTNTEPLSLFDVIEITGIVAALFLLSRMHTKVETLEQRVQKLHQELSIKLSEEKPKSSK